MKLRDVLAGLEITCLRADLDTEINAVRYDSRSVERGDLFVAVRGFQTDGHAFIPAAVNNGAAAVVCESAPDVDAPYIAVPDSRLALALAAKNFYRDPASEIQVIGVTGTNGKTTTTTLIKRILDSTGAKTGLIGTNAVVIGSEAEPAAHTTPESADLQALLRKMADAGCRCAVMEVSSHALSLCRVAGVRFAVGAFTNLTQDHLDFHKTMDNYAAAKAGLFAQCVKAVINADDVYSPVMLDAAQRGGAETATYSLLSPAADIYARGLLLKPDSLSFSAVTADVSETVQLGMPGRFSVYNALCAIGCCTALGVPLGQCAAALRGVGGPKGRMESVPTDGDYTIIIDYAHTPDALENALRTLREGAVGRVVAVFGCGGDRDRGKRPKMGKIAAEQADFAVITSDNPRTESPDAIIEDILGGTGAEKTNYTVIPDRSAAIEWAIENHVSGDIILLAGKGHETYQEVGHVRRHMDEREIVASVIEKRKHK
ncbi:MAG: UDP-N-acetylmuramoyl-L-alanyl-D-glutamate--2,6-diaminopimelate ligase [Oscillospiraceae bacterium]|nr:UDP-N-acetylmuramoyl-L-alanyl-D-glutamate--2,6-diaminopimelate ligase [Oscillospiraceae bacterium]